jgi:ribosomal protein L14E/L6E/L27E
MDEFKIGGYAVATAGHDFGKCYVIFLVDQEYVYLVDGRLRMLDHPKKKKKKHVKMLAGFDPVLADKIQLKSVINEEIKRAIKLLKYEI